MKKTTNDNTYYGIKLKGSICEFLEMFEDFHWILKSQNTGFLAVKVEEEQTPEMLEKTIFPKMIEEYKLIISKSKLNNKDKVLNLLQEYVNLEPNKTPVIIKASKGSNSYYKTWDELEKSNIPKEPKRVKLI